MAGARLRLLAAALASASGSTTGDSRRSQLDDIWDAVDSGRPMPFLSPPDVDWDAVAREADGDNPRPRPKVAKHFSADMLLDSVLMGMKFSGGVGKFHYDRPYGRNRRTCTTTSDYFRENATFEQDQVTVATDTVTWSNNTLGGLDENGACMIFPGQKAMDPFGWVKGAKHAGHKFIEGERCDLWAIHVEDFNYSAQMCLTEDGIPRELNQTYGGGGKFSGAESLRLSNAEIGPQSDDKFLPSYACGHNYPAAPCNGDEVQRLDVYRIFGPPEPLLLQDRNTGDVLGDLSFVCTQGSGEAYRSKLITHWKVQVHTGFGQYALCNFNGTDNVCGGVPEQLRTVGRRSGQMQGIGTRLGQCTDNKDVGSQFSFPVQAMCPDQVVPGHGNKCAWGNAKAIRTVKASCIMEERGLLEACQREIGHAPFLEAAKVWLLAFASDDPMLGGCPDADAEAEYEMEQDPADVQLMV